MPILPTASEPHQHRNMAESFGIDPERYHRTRPRYPDAMITEITPTAMDVLSVGCGTGIDAEQFRAVGCRVLGVEPDPRMAEFARRGGLEVEVSTFEAWEPAGRDFDVVAAGQAWHWVDPVAGAAQAARVLRPGGRLALFWNIAEQAAELNDAFAEVYRRVLPDSPVAKAATSNAANSYASIDAKAADGITQAGAFGEPKWTRFGWERTYSREEWLDVVPTQGMHTVLPPEKLAEVLAGLGAAIDSVGGEVPVRYTTLVVSAVRD
jgi:SAM-dependent methyltransferase